MKNRITLALVAVAVLAIASFSSAHADEVVEVTPTPEPVGLVNVWLLPDQNLIRSNFPGVGGDAIWYSKEVYRDSQDNFYVQGKHITLVEFLQVHINAEFVPRGATVSLHVAEFGR